MPTMDRFDSLQRLAQDRGYVLHKRPDLHYRQEVNGGFQLVDARTGRVMIGPRFDADLDDVEAFLK
jgi:hypothetical protein